MRWWPLTRRTKRPVRHDGNRSVSIGRLRRGYQPHFDVLEDRTLLATFTVTSVLDSGANTLREAVLQAGDGDTIQFAPNLNGQTIALTSGTLVLEDDISIIGLGANMLTVRNDGAFRTFTVMPNSKIAIQGLTIAGGSGGDGGIFVDTASALELTAVTLVGNNADRGAGVFSQGDLRIRDSALISNTAVLSGGAIYIASGTLAMVQSTVSGNTAGGDGGGIRNSGVAQLIDATIAFNQAGSNGGGLANAGNMTLS